MSEDYLQFNSKSPKYLEAKKSLPNELHDTYDKLVSDYYFYTVKNYGKGYVAYKVLADLIREGWTLDGNKKTAK